MDRNKRAVRFLIILWVLVVWNTGLDLWFDVHPLNDRLWSDYWDYEVFTPSLIHPFMHRASHAWRWWFPVMRLRRPAFAAFGLWTLFFRRD